VFKKILFTVIVLLGAFTAAKNVSAAQTYSEKITPNKLTIQREDGSKVTIDAFRIRGYNVAQLRTLVQACGGSIINAEDGYQIVTKPGGAAFTPVAFSGAVTVNVQFNVTDIMDKSGKFIHPAEPGWVFLTDYNYNWGSIRDVLAAMGYEIKSYSDDAKNARTSVVIGEIVKAARGMNSFPTPSGYVGAGPVYIYSEADLKPSIPAGYTVKTFTNPDYSGEKVWVYARDGVNEVRVYRVEYTDNNGSFTFTVNKLLYSTKLSPTDVLVIDTILPEGIPTNAVTFIGNDGKAYSFILHYNGRNGVEIAGETDLKGIK